MDLFDCRDQDDYSSHVDCWLRGVLQVGRIEGLLNIDVDLLQNFGDMRSTGSTRRHPMCCWPRHNNKNRYIMMDCVKDAKYMHGNKTNSNKFQYKYHDVSNVSIIHYSNWVSK